MKDSIIDLMNEMENHLKDLYPFLSDSDLDRMTRLTFGLSLFCDTEEEIGKWATRILQELDAPWAKQLLKNLGKEIARTVEKARKAGADPVEFVRVTYGMSHEDAAKAVTDVP